MEDRIWRKVLMQYGVEYAAVCSAEQCRYNQYVYKLHKTFGEDSPKSVMCFLAPYFVKDLLEDSERNLSLYACAEDYHLFFKEVSQAVISEMKTIYPDALFAAFSDSSPVDEVALAAQCGLGVIGKNGLLVNPVYGSYVFIGEIFSDLPPEEWGDSVSTERIEDCIGCGQCKRACPVGLEKGKCISALTQKKGILSEEEREILEARCLWGCDICQNVCPMNRRIKETPIAFFRENLYTHLEKETLDAMSEEVFLRRAFSWRGKEILIRNLAIAKERREENDQTDIR